MIVGSRYGAGFGGKMPCESCAVQFSVFKRKRVCCECERGYCSACLRRGGGAMCAPCRALSARPLLRPHIAHLRARDLQCFLQRQNVSTRGCVEKEDLLSLCLSHVNSAAYRRRGPRGVGGAFTLKGFTSNLNEFINSAFDLRPPGPVPQPAPPRPAPAPAHQRTGCYNATHEHVRPTAQSAQPSSHTDIRQERFTVTPGGERDVRVFAEREEVGETGGAGEAGPGRVTRATSRDSALPDSADCFEIEDVDDAGWEFVTRPAEPLPNDSEVLLTGTEGADPMPAPRAPPRSRVHADPGVGVSQRAASELDLRSSASADTVSADTADTASLQDEPLLDVDHRSTNTGTPNHVTLDTLRNSSELELLSVRQLKELLLRNRVEFRGCIERADLLTRAKMLYEDHAHYKHELDNLPIEDCCKICMAAPLECVLLECGHIAACTACSKQLAECPICRQYVVRAVRFFRS